MLQESHAKSWSLVAAALKLPALASAIAYHGEVAHIFTHIRHVYHVYSQTVNDAFVAAVEQVSLSGTRSHDAAQTDRLRWVSAAEFDDAAVPTNVRKQFALFNAKGKPKAAAAKPAKK